MNNVIDIAKLSSEIEEDIKQSTKSYIIRPSIALIEIGNNDINKIYAKQLEDACNRVGIYFRYFEFEDSVPELTIINKIKELNNDEYVNGITISLPIPEKYNEKRLLNTIVNSKDIDGLTDINIGRLISGRKTIAASSATGIMKLFKEYNVELTGKDITIIGDKNPLVRSLVSLLLGEEATVTICNLNTKDISKYTTNADIVISAINEKNIVKGNMIKQDAIVIDAGINVEDGKICGDVDFTSVSKKASLITPKVKEINPITISILLNNTLFCYNNKK